MLFSKCLLLEIGWHKTLFFNIHFDICHCKCVGGSCDCLLWTYLLLPIVEINFTINFYINYVLNYYKINRTSYCLCYSSCFAHPLMSWPEISENSFNHKERSLRIFFFMLCAWYILRPCAQERPWFFCRVCTYICFDYICLMASCLRNW